MKTFTTTLATIASAMFLTTGLSMSAYAGPDTDTTHTTMHENGKSGMPNKVMMKMMQSNGKHSMPSKKVRYEAPKVENEYNVVSGRK